ncbi:T-cell differentiation antigen CD6 isoform X5 [Canis lupus familiaris]|uniref:T-cell differentiation antigen CD6 isoform X5 n=1 Tax=Canis lupus familiaris TaxID=9615 RepID=UPI0018F625B4|nr:T-cell differentiation antigen CD6 isoform X5 [Canis lupus familiaris]XP_038420356.1 T-cell differentiation antigen CD6 isoform X5 [Canis lupus familiaris]
MAPDMWLFSATVGLLTAALSGHLTPAPSDQPNTSSAKSQTLEPGQQLGVRLVNGSSRCSGLVEVWFRLSWGPACRALWDSRASEAVCRALGCGGAAESTQPTSPSLELPPRPGAGNASEALNATLALAPAVLCRGAEWRLCYVEERACDSNGSPAEVTCAENRAVRLTGGSGPCAGRVEMLEHRQWGSVCDDSWDLEDSHVVCRQLNCGWAVQALPGLHFAPGRGPIHRDQVNCSGAEAYLWDCPGLPGDGYCGHKEDAGVVCSGSRSLLNLSTPEVPASIQPITVESSVTMTTEDWKPRELMLLILCITLGILCLGLLISMAFIFLKVKGKYALPVMVNSPHLLTTTPEGINSYQDVPITISKEEVPMLPIQAQAPPPKDPDSSSDSDYEHYDFSTQPPVALTTFYNSQRHRITDEEVQQNRFQMPLLEEAEEVQQNQFQMLPPEEGLEEMNVSQVPPIGAGHYMANTPSLGSQHRPRSSSESSTSSGEDYCNSPSSRLPPWTPQVFSAERSPHLEQPPNLELAGSQATFSAGPLADDSSSTSSGEWYQNFQPPPQPPSTEQFECPGPPTPQPDSVDGEDYDDIGAA